MPTTRSGAAAREEEGNGNDELDVTVCERATVSQRESPALQLQIDAMAKQLNDLQSAILQISNMVGNQVVTPSNQQNAADNATSPPGVEEIESPSIAETLANLNRTLSTVRADSSRKLYDLPEFDGRPEDWPMFRESFVMTTEEYQYSERQNMLRLQKAIKGKAREVVECLLIHSSNVPRIIETLQERFGRPDQLVKSQISRIRNFPAISENRLEQLVPFATKVQNLANFLEAAGCEYHLGNPTLMEELILKLPVQRRLDWARHAVSIQPRATIRHLSDWLQELARVVNTACINLNHQGRGTESRGEPRPRFFHADELRRESQGRCSLCQGEHELAQCKSFVEMEPALRWKTVRRDKLCFNCLGIGHRSNRCAYKHKCAMRNCPKMVHGLLHSEGSGTNRTPQQQHQVYTNALTPTATKVLFKILPVRLYANGREIECYAFFDEGSAISMMNQSVADRLGLKGRKDKLTLKWFGNKEVTQMAFEVDVQISGTANGNGKFDVKNVKVVRDLQLPTQTLNLSELHWRYRYTKGLPIQDYDQATPELLIGLDNAHLGAARRTIADGWKGPTVIKTKVGWLVYGNGSRRSASGYNHSFFAQCGEDDSLEQLVRNYIVDDSLGVSTAQKHVESVEVATAKRLLESTTRRKDGRFETGLLWRYETVILPNSRQMAEKRLLALERKFQRDKDFQKQYAHIISEYERKGYARRLSESEAGCRKERTWYLPHFGVSNPNKPGKLRLVFDAAAEVEGVSLNSMLLNGPDQSQPLTTVLMKFREKPIGVCADIVEMFHQVQIRQEDQDAQRFLWRNDPKEEIGEYVMSVMTFGATCSPCSAQYVKNQNARDFQNEFPDAAHAIVNNHYVDDFVHCFATEEEALRITEQVMWIHEQGGFKLRRFLSNAKTVSERLNEEEIAKVVSLDKGDAGHYQKVLGMYWDTEKDELKFVLSFARVDARLMKGERRPTKREMLSIAMSVFDPFGLAAEFTLAAKLVLQSVWREQVGWDEGIPDEAYAMWLEWLKMLKDIETLTMPRCYHESLSNNAIELHVFADASETAYAAVAYWRIRDHAGRTHLAFVTGKAKCAPLKLTTVPRLELQSAVLATRLRVNVLQSHNVVPTRTVMWSDSKTTLAWIKSDHRRYKPYVAHRVNEILANSETTEWRWLPSASNPADFGTRMRSTKRESFWASGPNFMTKDETDWPAPELLGQTQEELRAKFVGHLNVESDMFAKYSCLIRLKRIVAWMLRLRHNALEHPLQRRNGRLTAAELETSELVICRAAQLSAYPEEYRDLKAKNRIQRGSVLWKLTPYMDDTGVIRIKGRIDAAVAVPLCSRRPVILPQDHHITNLVVDYYHRKWKHQNEGTIIAEIRRRYWIPHIRTAVRRAGKRCQVCKISKAKPEAPMMGQLPEDRLTPFVRPFSYVGIDYMGPFLIVSGRRVEKRWIALFTCLATRAIHMEIARDLTTDTCLLCIRNFMCRRGKPVRIRSDNATNFIGADKELQRQVSDFDNGKISDVLANDGIEWIFNCPLNPHAGGCWERLVRSVKRAMGHALYKNLTEHSLYSLMCEAENIVNSRPLTHIPIDAPTVEPLTPNHFLLGAANTEQTPHPREEEHQVTRKEWRKVQQAQHRFWKRWLAEYLPDLCRRPKWYQPVEPLREDDIVLVCDSNLHRSRWPMGKVARVFPGKDGQVRMAEVRTSAGTFKRPACVLAKLEICESN